MGILRPFYVDSPSTWAEQDDGLDFPTDPDQRVDKLPQPFRLVDKILDSLFEDAWTEITARQAVKEEQASYRQLPSLEGAQTAPLPYQVYNICSTPDHEMVIAAGAGGLLAFSHDDVTRPVFKYNLEGGYLKAAVTNGAESGTYIIAALDPEGMVTIIGVTRAGFIEIAKLMIENEEKVLNIWLEESNLVLSIAGERSIVSLSFYSLPLPSWTEPLELISSQRLQGNEEEEQVFTKPDTRTRVKCPGPVMPCPKNNLGEALGPILGTIERPVTLGQGLYHMLPSTYFDKRREILEKLPKYQGIDWDNADNSVNVGHVVFVSSDRVLIWWTEHHIATLHSLQDIETVLDSFIFCSDITCVTANQSRDKIAVGLHRGLCSVIDLEEGLSVQCSLVSRSPVSHLEFVENKLLASTKDGKVAVLSGNEENSCAMIQHIASYDSKNTAVSQIYRLIPYSNLAVVTLSPGKVAIVDVDSFRAIAVIPVWTSSTPKCASLTKKYLCLIPENYREVMARLEDIHHFAPLYVNSPPISEEQECSYQMFVFDIGSNPEVADKGYLNTAQSKTPSLAALSQSYFSQRETEKRSRHQRLRERWFQYTEELEAY